MRDCIHVTKAGSAVKMNIFGGGGTTQHQPCLNPGRFTEGSSTYFKSMVRSLRANAIVGVWVSRDTARGPIAKNQ